MYDLSGYGMMLADSGRMEPYIQALRQLITDKSVVLDIGTGTGIFPLIACQLGAKKVYAIEPSNLIQVGVESARVSEYGDRIEFIQDISTQVTLPEPVDIILSDLRGILPLLQQHIPSIVDARNRFLSPNGVLIPQQDTIWATVVEAPNLYNSLVSCWVKNRYKLNLEAARKRIVNSWRKGWVRPSQLLAQPQVWTTLDYTRIENPNVSHKMTFQPARSGTMHGLSVWFDTKLIEGIGFSTAPGMPELVYGMAFFPFLEPVSLSLEDTVSVNLQANLVNNEYIWRWDTQVLSRGDNNPCKAEFKQSTFFAQSISPTQLRKQAGNHIPQLNQPGKIAQLVLEHMGKGQSVKEIAGMLIKQFPTAFSSEKEALTRVGEFSRLYSE